MPNQIKLDWIIIVVIHTDQVVIHTDQASQSQCQVDQ